MRWFRRYSRWDVRKVGSKPEVVKEFSRRWAGELEVPCFVKFGVVAALNDPGGEVNVAYVLVGCGVPKEDSAIIVTVKFGGA